MFLGGLCLLLLCGRLHARVCQRRDSGGANGIAEGIVTTNRVYKHSEETLYGNDGIFLSGRLLKPKMCKLERGSS